jgi:site-specific DNA recombinase
MKKVFGYIRVSTVKQGNGVSLQEQKESIIRYAEKNNLNIIQWFEELETAAKQGRPLFTMMMKLLRLGKAAGAIIHKIDRSARNLKDWAALGDLIDEGIEVHFAHESLDMDTRGGRLAADIQAVIASDYIRNLRDEALKGLYGRLKQGIYPFGAPIGYLNNGSGNVKTIDPISGPLVLKAFELYSTEKYNLYELAKKMYELGLRNTNNKAISKTTISKILNNPFYVGVMIIKGKTFNGNHEPLVSVCLFNQVKSILHGKTNTKAVKHSFLFRRLIKCGSCNYSLIAESKKDHVYYRCHNKGCTTKTVREDRVLEPVMSIMSSIQFDKIEANLLNQLLEEVKLNWTSSKSKLSEAIKMQEQKVSQKLERLTDAYIENIIDKDAYNKKKGQLLIELKEYQGKNKDIALQKESIFRRANNYLEFLKTVLLSFNSGILEEKRKIIKIITSNLSFSENKLSITIKSPFLELADRSLFLSGGHVRPIPRTSTFEFAIPATNGNNQHTPKEVRFITANTPIISEPHPPLNLPSPEVDAFRDSMKQLLDMILDFFEEEQRKVDAGILELEQTILNDVQEDDTNTQYSPRPVPENFKRIRA